jgi:hypothetical protein
VTMTEKLRKKNDDIRVVWAVNGFAQVSTNDNNSSSLINCWMVDDERPREKLQVLPFRKSFLRSMADLCPLIFFQPLCSICCE